MYDHYYQLLYLKYYGNFILNSFDFLTGQCFFIVTFAQFFYMYYKFCFRWT